MAASRERPSVAALMSLVGALGRAGRLAAMDAVLDAFPAHGHDISLEAITALIYHHGCHSDIDGPFCLLTSFDSLLYDCTPSPPPAASLPC
jgi:hypothetical protein